MPPFQGLFLPNTSPQLFSGQRRNSLHPSGARKGIKWDWVEVFFFFSKTKSTGCKIRFEAAFCTNLGLFKWVNRRRRVGKKWWMWKRLIVAAGCEWREAAERRKLYARLLIASDYRVEWPGALLSATRQLHRAGVLLYKINICVCVRARLAYCVSALRVFFGKRSCFCFRIDASTSPTTCAHVCGSWVQVCPCLSSPGFN